MPGPARHHKYRSTTSPGHLLADLRGWSAYPHGVGEVALADVVTRGLGVVMPPGFAPTTRQWFRVEGAIESAVSVVRNPSSFGLGEDLCIEARVRLHNGRGYGFHRVDGTTTGGRNWWLRPQQTADEVERLRIRSEIEDHVRDEVLPWIERRATPSGYLDHLEDDRVPYRLIEACLAFGEDEKLAGVLAGGPQTGLPTDRLSRYVYALPAEAALRAYAHLRLRPSPEWSEHARGVLASYRGRPPKSERRVFEELKALVDALTDSA